MEPVTNTQAFWYCIALVVPITATLFMLGAIRTRLDRIEKKLGIDANSP